MQQVLKFWLERPDLQAYSYAHSCTIEMAHFLEQGLRLCLPALAAQTRYNSIRLTAVSALAWNWPESVSPRPPRLSYIPVMLPWSVVREIHMLMCLMVCIALITHWVSRRWTRDRLLDLLPQVPFTAAHELCPRALVPWSGLSLRRRMRHKTNPQHYHYKPIDMMAIKAFLHMGGSILEVTNAEGIQLEVLLHRLSLNLTPREFIDLLFSQIAQTVQRAQHLRALA